MHVAESAKTQRYVHIFHARTSCAARTVPEYCVHNPARVRSSAVFPHPDGPCISRDFPRVTLMVNLSNVGLVCVCVYVYTYIYEYV